MSNNSEPLGLFKMLIGAEAFSLLNNNELFVISNIEAYINQTLTNRLSILRDTENDCIEIEFEDNQEVTAERSKELEHSFFPSMFQGGTLLKAKMASETAYDVTFNFVIGPFLVKLTITSL